MTPFILLICLLTGSWTPAGLCPEDLASADDLEPIQQALRERLRSTVSHGPIEAAGEIILAPDLLLLFYGQRNFRPAWIQPEGLSPQIQSLIEAIELAPLEGLTASDYHLAKIEDLGRTAEKGLKKRKPAAASMAADLELLCSDAFFTFASHLSQGKVAPETSEAAWQGKCIDENLVKILEKSLVSGGIGETLQSLLPPHSFYGNLRRALEHYRSLAKKTDWRLLAPTSPLQKGDQGKEVRQVRDRLLVLGDLNRENKKPRDVFDDALESALRDFQARNGLEVSGILDPPTLAALNLPLQERIRQVEANLERWRWMPHDLGERFIYVNIANFELEVFDDWRRALTMKVVVGSEAWQTPDFSSQMTHLIINPYWTIPIPVLLKETVGYILQDPCYFRNNKMLILRGTGDEEVEVDPTSIDWSRLSEKNLNFRVRQEPGPQNILGRLKFVFPNEYEIFLHDTPYQEDFAKTSRTFSHGCIRAEKPIDLALYVLRGKPGWDLESILTAIDAGVERTVKLVEPINIYFLYCTAWQEDDGMIQFRPDVYKRDARLMEALGQIPPLPQTPRENPPAIQGRSKSLKADEDTARRQSYFQEE